MKNTLYGYRIIDGKAVIFEEEAEQIRSTADYYLEGYSFTEAASKAGLIKQHGTIRHMLGNTAYLGNDFYPAIIDEKVFYAIQVERNRRIGWFDRDMRTKKIPAPLSIYFKFKLPELIASEYSDPFEQAAYVFSLIEEVE